MGKNMKKGENTTTNRIAFVCASGPSLSDDQCDLVSKFRGKNEESLIITVNDTYRKFIDRFPPDIIYCADLNWLKFHAVRLRQFMKESSSIIYMPDRENIRGYIEDLRNPIVLDLWIKLVKCYNYRGLYKDNTAINCGRNSGYQAVHLARNLGAEIIILIGFDMNVDPSTGKDHWFGSHPKGLRSPVSEFDSFVVHFRTLASDLRKAGVRVINATGPNSRLNNMFEIENLSTLLFHYECTGEF